MFGVCIVHTDKSNVIPLCPEFILNQDGHTKNDCERNTCKRFLENFILEDGLASNAPNIRMIEEHNLLYILGPKPGDHQFLFEQLGAHESTENIKLFWRMVATINSSF